MCSNDFWDTDVVGAPPLGAAPIHVELVRNWFIAALTPAQLDAMTAISTAVLDRLVASQIADAAGMTNAS